MEDRYVRKKKEKAGADIRCYAEIYSRRQIEIEQDNPSIGLLLCKSKNNVVAEYSLKDISKPIGVSEYKITSSLPDNLEKQLPSVEDIKKRIK